MIKTTHLRVYLPVADASDLHPPSSGDVEVTPFEDTYGIIGESMTEDVLVAEWRDRTYACPRTPRLRVLEGVLAIRTAYRQLGSASVIPEEVAHAARRELEALREEEPGARAHILTSAWHVPMRWFVPFDPLEKEVVGDGRGCTVRYRVTHDQAMGRLRRAISILERSEMPDAITAEVEELRTWLEDFPGEALVELDYGSVAEMFTEVDLVMDDSVAEVWASLEALESGDWQAAGEHYGAIVSRWASSMAVGYSN